MMRALIIALGLVTAGACTQTTTTTGNPPADAGRIVVYRAGDGLDVELDSSIAPLSIAATVVVEGASISGPAVLGDGARDRNLFSQKQSGGELRFAISDSRGIRIASKGVLVHIPLAGTPTKVKVNTISAAKDDGNAISLTAFDAAPGSR